MGKPCCAAAAKPTMIKIRGVAVGLAALDEIFKKLFESGAELEKVDKKDLVKKVAVYNYIPGGLEEKYAEAIMEEYKKYYYGRKK